MVVLPPHPLRFKEEVQLMEAWVERLTPITSHLWKERYRDEDFKVAYDVLVGVYSCESRCWMGKARVPPRVSDHVCATLPHRHLACHFVASHRSTQPGKPVVAGASSLLEYVDASRRLPVPLADYSPDVFVDRANDLSILKASYRASAPESAGEVKVGSWSFYVGDRHAGTDLSFMFAKEIKVVIDVSSVKGLGGKRQVSVFTFVVTLFFLNAFMY